MSVEVAILVVALAAGLYMAWNIGANDVANAMGTSVGSGALTLGMAVLLAGIFEFSGAVLVGGHVTDTVRGRIVDIALFEPTGQFGADGPVLLAVGMVSALLASAVWLHFATILSLPVSTTHSIVGAVAGFGVVALGFDGVQWGMLGRIVASWFVSPFLGALIAFFSFFFIRRRILRSDDPVSRTLQVAPWMVLTVVAIIVLSFIYKALSAVIADPPAPLALGLALGTGMVAALLFRWLLRRFPPPRDGNPYRYVERVFAGLQIVTACYVAFAHGANDVANAVGPVAAVVNLAAGGFAVIGAQVPVPFWVLVVGGLGIVLGLATLGYRVIATVGRQITEMTPTRGFSAEFGAATTVLVASLLGLPVSTTHTLVGAVVGVGLAQGLAALNLRVLRNIVNSWVATVPAAAILSAVLFTVLRLILV